MKRKLYLYITALAALACSISSCNEKVDEGDFAIAQGNTISQYLLANDSLTLMAQLLQRVTLSHRDNASSLIGVLSARGNYTCFFPSDRCMREYVREITGTDDITRLTDEQAELVAYNSIIDNGSQNAFESPDFPIEGTFSVPCLSERLLSCQYDKKTDGYIVNKNARVILSDLECTNGRVNIVDHVLAPSLLALPEIVMSADNMKIMGQLMQVTGWAGKLTEYQDVAFNTREHPEKRTFTGVGTFTMQQDRYLGFTAFVEPDEVYARDWGVPAPILNGGVNLPTSTRCWPLFGKSVRLCMVPPTVMTLRTPTMP